MNKKGQALVLFVIFFPLFIFIFAYLFDVLYINFNYIRLKGIENNAIKYIKDEKNLEDVKQFIYENDKNIEIISITDNYISLKSKIKSIFGQVIGHDYYIINVKDYIKKNEGT